MRPAFVVIALVITGGCAQPRVIAPVVVNQTRIDEACRNLSGEEGSCVLTLSPQSRARRPSYERDCLNPPDSLGVCVLRDQRASPFR